ncbi:MULTISPECIES: XdhC/CoxI family protein [unclassified Curtobacterium]|uniref:XdhC family protein n=1 Tax=unclassified Curtobacterium TaxID=257496 RepID=UPI0021AC9D38|nr:MULTISPECIES: XdhC/CoxI family protein [unclassified Curtobacterium]WIB64691.1 XdhC family protein [Curtobacterium sp. MCBD17_040]WIB68536.1 XdhC family protein [Curtobacterium sp. MCBD17_035]
MFEIADRILARLDAGEAVAVATAVGVDGSAPRGAGTSMAVTVDGTVIGSISGGCVEGAVYEMCERVLASGVAELESFGHDDHPFAVGLACGGRVEVLATRLTRDDLVAVDALRRAAAGRPARVTRVLEGPRLGAIVARPDECSDVRSATERNEPAPRMVVVGAVEFAVALTNAASTLGYRVTVCDPRPVFATPERFPAAAEVVVAWPPTWLACAGLDADTAVVVVSHDDRFDAEVVALALERGAGYVGAMGSRRTHERRMQELAGLGVTDVARLRSPIGLDLGAETPEEVAVSILAEVLATRNATSARPLRERSGNIHPARAASTAS